MRTIPLHTVNYFVFQKEDATSFMPPLIPGNYILKKPQFQLLYQHMFLQLIKTDILTNNNKYILPTVSYR